MDHPFDELPSSLPAYFGILARRRRYSDDPLPPIAASAKRALFDPARLARYRALVGAADDGFLPPFAAQLLAAPLHLRLLADPAFPFAALGLVHLENRLSLRGPVADDLPLELRAWVACVEPHRSGHSITLTTEARPAGELAAKPLWVADTVALARDVAPPRGQRSAERPLISLEDAVIVDVPEDMGRAYARVAGDLNPIHQHALLARPFGFRRAIVHGTWTAARCISHFWPYAAREEVDLRVRFRAPVYLPSTLHLGRADGALLATDTGRTREHLRIERGPA